MDNYQVYKDIQTRTGGEIYLGILGPVRTGKSTFIKRFMNLCVIPGILDVHQKERAIDELPLSGEGTIITTVELKFIPKEAATIQLAEGIPVKIRMIDSVGYLVDGASGHTEHDKERMVKTPWHEEPMTFRRAAEIGTRKVMEHSTIGILITTDGTIGTMGRSDYEMAEHKAVEDMKDTKKPFIIVLNSRQPFATSTQLLAKSMEEQYGASVIPINCEQLRMDDVLRIFREILLAFPVTELRFYYPEWVNILSEDHEICQNMSARAYDILNNIHFLKDVTEPIKTDEDPYLQNATISSIHMENGVVDIRMELMPELYYQILSDMSGMEIKNEYQFVRLLQELVQNRKAYEKVETAMKEVVAQGYSIVMPIQDDIRISAPEVVRHGNKYGVKLRAEAPSVNLIQANIITEIAPIVGTEDQAKDLMKYMDAQSTAGPDGIWNTNIFGKSILELVENGIQAKVDKLTQESRGKLQNSMEKIINENNGGLICFII